MSTVPSLERLVVWQRSLELVQEIYRITKLLPQDERFGLVTQMRRSAVSVSSNIAEGHARNSRKEFVQFVAHAYGSSAELYTQLTITRNTKLIPDAELKNSFQLLEEVQRMLLSLRRTLVTKTLNASR